MDQAPGSPQGPLERGPAGRGPAGDGPLGDGHGGAGLPTCYRHPDRETGIRCTRCERPICPECMVDASVGFHCPQCARGGSGSGPAPAASRPRTVTGGSVDRFTHRFELLGQAYDPLLGSVEGVAQGQWYRLLTAMFLHGGFLHIAFNMLSLWWIGGPLEAALGRARYLALYLASGLAGSALSYLIAAPNQPSVGASGAIFGLFGAMAVLMRRLRYDMRPVVALLVINLVITFGWGGIAWQAHVGGLVAGLIVGYAMVHAPRERRALVQYGTCALVLVAVVVMTLIRTAQLG
ncbi:rhomboid family intramembrane serine protease [Streptomyces mexicanus]|uniref:rhomboid family intramembrane serine protease n=1 Tax=Streptomyces mexicanus TaxID=178566 RepID=UPI0031E728BB